MLLQSYTRHTLVLCHIKQTCSIAHTIDLQLQYIENTIYLLSLQVAMFRIIHNIVLYKEENLVICTKIPSKFTFPAGIGKWHIAETNQINLTNKYLSGATFDKYPGSYTSGNTPSPSSCLRSRVRSGLHSLWR